MDTEAVKNIVNSKAFKDTIKDANIPEGSTEYYHAIKKELEFRVGRASEEGIGPTSRSVMDNIRREMVEEVGNSNQRYREAMEAFRGESGPIDRMEVGQALNRRLFPSDHVPIQELRSRQFLDAVSNGDEFAQKVTGFPGTRMDDVLSGFGQADDVERTLRQNDTFNALADSGRRAAGDVLEDVKPGQFPGLLERHVVIANSLLSRAGKHETKSIMEFISQNLDRPAEIARLVSNASPEEKAAVNAIIRAVRQGIPMAAAAGAN